MGWLRGPPLSCLFNRRRATRPAPDDYSMPCCRLLNREAAEKLEHYVLERQKDGGGFGLTPRLPATVEDTYYAVRILELLESQADLSSSRAYVCGLEQSLSRRAKLIYEVLYLRRKFACPPTGSLPPPAPGLLEETYYFGEIAKIWHNAAISATAGYEGAALTLPADPVIREVHYFLALKAGDLSPPEKDHWIQWVQACQNPDGGFGFRRGTTSFMDNVLPAAVFRRSPAQGAAHCLRSSLWPSVWRSSSFWGWGRIIFSGA